MRVQYIGPQLERVLPVDGRARFVKRGETIEVDDALGAALSAQAVWAAIPEAEEPAVEPFDWNDYTIAELHGEIEKRNLEAPASAKKAELVAILEADDEGSDD